MISERGKAAQVLTLNTVAFTVCFACWMLNGVLVTFLVEHGVFQLTASQIGWLIGIPVLTGSLVRLPLGILTDKYGGRPVFTALMLLSAVPMYLLGETHDYTGYLLASLGFGLSGGSFAVGIAYSSVWFAKNRQGTALGIFGAGNAGSAITSMFAPTILMKLTANGANIENWRQLPRLYAAGLVVMSILFWCLTYPKKTDVDHVGGLAERLVPLKNVRVWRFGLYYFLVFGGFVALSQWLIPYYVTAYTMPVTTAGLMATIFSLPSGVIRALGGWISDHYGARRVMYWVLGAAAVCCTLLIVPRMDVELPGKGVIAAYGGTVSSVSKDAIAVGNARYALRSVGAPPLDGREVFSVLPERTIFQSAVVKPGDRVVKRQLLATGVTRIRFQANVWIFTALVFLVGFAMGIGKAAVYRHIPDYFPHAVGVVGGIVGVIGGLGGFVCPIIFGEILERTGVWTTCWVFLAALSAICLLWMHAVVQRMMRSQVPELMRQMESARQAVPVDGEPVRV